MRGYVWMMVRGLVSMVRNWRQPTAQERVDAWSEKVTSLGGRTSDVKITVGGRDALQGVEDVAA